MRPFKLVLSVLLLSIVTAKAQQQVKALRVMTYNIHHGVGMDGVLSLQRIADIIREEKADVVSLNEVDRHFDARSNYEDQAAWLADALHMHYVYQTNLLREPTAASGNRPREYGNAILSKYPISSSVSRQFKEHDHENRGVLLATIQVNGEEVCFGSSHWSLEAPDRLTYAEEIVGWLKDIKGIQIITGDFNAVPESDAIKNLTAHFTDVFINAADQYTIPADKPTRRIDYIMVNPGIKHSNYHIVNTTASDHRPVVADIQLK